MHLIPIPIPWLILLPFPWEFHETHWIPVFHIPMHTSTTEPPIIEVGSRIVKTSSEASRKARVDEWIDGAVGVRQQRGVVVEHVVPDRQLRDSVSQ